MPKGQKKVVDRKGFPVKVYVTVNPKGGFRVTDNLGDIAVGEQVAEFKFAKVGEAKAVSTVELG